MSDEKELTIEEVVREKLTQTLRNAAKQIEHRANESAFRSLAVQSPAEQVRALVLRGWCSSMHAVANELDAIYTAADMGDEALVRRISTDSERLLQQAEGSVQQLQQES